MSLEPKSKKRKRVLLSDTDISKYYMHDKNESLGLCYEKLSCGSAKEAWFYCSDCNHEYKQIINRICSYKYICPYCTDKAYKLCGDKECNYCFQRSVYSTQNGRYWDFEKNDTEPWKVSRFSAKSYFFNCPICKHSILLKTSNILRDGYTCNQCSGYWKFCEDDMCDYCFNRSFASNEKSRFLHPTKNSEDVLKWPKGCRKEAWFICENCNHDFKMSLNSVNKGIWCKFCCGYALCKNDDCEFCFKLSFASNPLSKYWSSKNTKNPREVRCKSGLSIIFDCPFCKDDYIATLKSVSRGNWCKCIRHKTENLVFSFLKSEYQEASRNVSFNWCVLESGLKGKYDFVIGTTILEVIFILIKLYIDR